MGKNKILTGLISITVAVVLFADDAGVSETQQNSSDGSSNASENGKTVDLNLNRAYLQLYSDRERIREVRAKSDAIDKELDGTADLAESLKPLEKPMTTLDSLYLHPMRSVSVMLPQGSKITHIAPTFDSKFIEYDEKTPTNIFTILSMPSFTSGDVTIYYSRGERNYLLKLICEKYSQVGDSTKKYHGVIVYKDYKELSPFDVMEAFRKEYGKYPTETFSFITIDRVVYKIIQDEKYGQLSIPNGKRYRIETNIKN